jgi:small redox-active disulfide protein 2
MLEIKVAGPGCKNCLEVKARVARVLADLKVESAVHEVKEFQDIAASGVMMTPGLILNGKVISQGKVPSEEQIKTWILDAISDE